MRRAPVSTGAARLEGGAPGASRVAAPARVAGMIGAARRPVAIGASRCAARIAPPRSSVAPGRPRAPLRRAPPAPPAAASAQGVSGGDGRSVDELRAGVRHPVADLATGPRDLARSEARPGGAPGGAASAPGVRLASVRPGGDRGAGGEPPAAAAAAPAGAKDAPTSTFVSPSASVPGEEDFPPIGVILGHLAVLLKDDVLLLGMAVVFLVTAASSELTVPGLVSDCIFAAASGSPDELWQRLRLLLLAAGSLGLAAGCRSVAFCTLNARLLERLRTRVFAIIMAQPVGWFDQVETGQLTSRLGADSASVSRFVATVANVTLRSGFQCVGSAITLVRLCPAMAAACISVGVVQGAMTVACGEYLRVTQRAYQDGMAASAGVAEESFLLSRIVRTFGTESVAVRGYARTLGVLTRIYTAQGRVYSLTLGCNLFLSVCMRVAALLYGVSAVRRGLMDAKSLTAFMLYVDAFSSGAQAVAEQFGPAMESLGASERVVGFLTRTPAPQLSSGVRPDRLVGNIEFRDVRFAYPARPHSLALRGLSLRIPAGSRVAIVGLSGSGKSSLVALLQRLYDPTEGAVLVDGVDLRAIDSAWFRERMGVVGQDPRLFSMTVAENIAYGCPSATRADVVAAARAANAAGFIDSLPLGYDTPVTDRLLSGGQKQRIAIARALVREPVILLLDEATSALDSESEAAVQAALDRAMGVAGRTVLVIAHRLSTVRNADFTVVMSHGRIAEIGTHDELIERNGIYAALVRRQEGKVQEADNDLAPIQPKPEDAPHLVLDDPEEGEFIQRRPSVS